jgi:hypothetical protein
MELNSRRGTIAGASGIVRKERLDAGAPPRTSSRRVPHAVDVSSLKLWRVRMSAEKVPEGPCEERDLKPFPGSRDAGNRAKLTRRLRTRFTDFITRWSGPPPRVDVDPRQDMRWTCPDCRVRHATSIDPDAEAGRIVEVNCKACGTRHEASLFFRLQKPGKARMTIGVVWL